MKQSVAPRLAALLEPLFGGSLPIRIRAWDSSEAGPADAPTVVVRSRRALRRLLWQPGELGLAQAYITGEIEVEGDLTEGLQLIWAAIRDRGLSPPKLTSRQIVAAVGAVARLGAIGPPPSAPAAQAKLSGVLHSRSRDRAAIAHHYDLSNEFYALLLDEQMAYSCAYFTSTDPGYTVADAQRDKLDLICRKLGLGPGARLLDIGCGWGALSLHAAQHYGAQVLGVTLSRQQQDFVLARVAERGLAGRVEIRLQDYRAIPATPAADFGGFDAVASIEMGEHVGAANYPTFAGVLHRCVREGGRVLVQQMSRRDRPGGGAFIECFVAPDMHMRPVGETVALLEDAGLEVRDVQAMREHYGWTVRAWSETLEKNWAAVVDLVGEQVARVWRLYLVGAALVFEEGRMGVDQILCVKRSPAGVSGMPPVRDSI
ncbi:MAG TPA: cyclopropane-fatty-acyl-phospholipid synthase family protein [Sporichthyaceae bacterium]|nr:cyclopropane-fatty-acyl-phospholipid synthase family protein [Sporichthyaceae bacterium]